ncbi:hypothetical protein ACKLNR_006334 [Fusarium oxysporum f. sp. zingiberi]
MLPAQAASCNVKGHLRAHICCIEPISVSSHPPFSAGLFNFIRMFSPILRPLHLGQAESTDWICRRVYALTSLQTSTHRSDWLQIDEEIEDVSIPALTTTFNDTKMHSIDINLHDALVVALISN